MSKSLAFRKLLEEPCWPNGPTSQANPTSTTRPISLAFLKRACAHAYSSIDYHLSDGWLPSRLAWSNGDLNPVHGALAPPCGDPLLPSPWIVAAQGRQNLAQAPCPSARSHLPWTTPPTATPKRSAMMLGIGSATARLAAVMSKTSVVCVSALMTQLFLTNGRRIQLNRATLVSRRRTLIPI